MRFRRRAKLARVEKARREREARDENIRQTVWMLCNLATGRNAPYPHAAPRSPKAGGSDQVEEG